MRLEDVNNQNVNMLSDKEIRNLRDRANQLSTATDRWKEEIAKSCIGITDPIPREKFLKLYGILFDEMQKRKMKFTKTHLDIRITKCRMRGIDVGGLPTLVIREGVVSLSGEFVRSPRNADIVDLFVDSKEFGKQGIPYLIEKRMAEKVLDDTGLCIRVTEDIDSLQSPLVPVYDLMLVPRQEIQEVSVEKLGVGASNETLSAPSDEGEQEGLEIELTDISKPYPKEHAARQLDPGQFDDFRRENNKFGPGIHAIWGIKGSKAKLQSIRFSSNKFTVKQANKWLEDHKYKPVSEPAKVSKDSFIKNEDQKLVGGIVYEVGEVDAQGDMIQSPTEIWKAMESFAENGAVIKFMHSGNRVNATVIESFQAEEDTIKGGSIIPSGAWYITAHVSDEEIWKDIKSGRIGGFSMSGRANAKEVS